MAHRCFPSNYVGKVILDQNIVNHSPTVGITLVSVGCWGGSGGFERLIGYAILRRVFYCVFVRFYDVLCFVLASAWVF